MNYIRHLNHVLECFIEDERILPRHISMYMALFHLWNKLKFVNTIQFARSELMPLSKIGSLKYYHLTLRELDEWGYIQYHPSKSIYKGSGVTIITCVTNETSSGITSATTSEASGAGSTATSSESSTGTNSVRTGETTSEALLINTKKTVLNPLNNDKLLINKRDCARDTPIQTFSSDALYSEEKKVDHADTNAKKHFQKPSVSELESYFKTKEVAPMEAQRFFNHFESNGWKVGGKSPMKDWKAAVRNWILNMTKYQGSKAGSEQNPLSTSNDKDYAEPL